MQNSKDHSVDEFWQGILNFLKIAMPFYTAQSYRDADMPEKAIEWYATCKFRGLV